MKNFQIIVIVVILNIFLAGCPKPCIRINYSFSVDARITPDLDSIKVGDTIYLVSSFPAELKDQRTGELVNYSNSAGIGNTLAISNLPTGDTIAKDAVFDFDYISIDGRIYNDRNIPSPDRVQQITYMESNGTYNLKVGLIAKQPGVYIIGLGDGLSNGKKKNHNCEKASFNTNVINVNQHFYLIEKWKPDIVFNDFGRKHGYAFKVY